MTAAAVATGVAAAAVGVAASVWVAASGDHRPFGVALGAAVALAFVLVGAVVAAARPHNHVGWVLFGGGMCWALGAGAVDLARHGIVDVPGSLHAVSFLAVGGSVVRGAGWWLTTVGVVMVFPDGHVAGPRWRRLPTALAVVIGASSLGALLADDANLLGLGSWRNPLALGALQPVAGLLSLASVALGAAVAVCCIVGLWERWGRGKALERRQILAFAFVAALPLIAAPIALGTGAGWVFSAAALPLPFVIGFVVLARDVYELRSAANRTLVWLALSTVVVLLYGLVIVGLGSRFNAQGAQWLPWLAAAVVAVAFAPLRDVLQRAVNRLTYGRWDQPYEVLAELGQRLEAATDTDLLLRDVVAELEGLGLEHVTILTTDDEVAAGGPVYPDATMVPLSAYGQPVGSLLFATPERSLRAGDRRLVDDLAGHLGAVLHGRALTRDLQRALELAVLAREEERRRLRRDLHDGLGPALAGHLLQLDVLAGKVAGEQPVVAEVAALQADLRATVLEVRRVVEGLRPPALDELGLVHALTQVLARLTDGTGVRLTVRAEPLPSCPRRSRWQRFASPRRRSPMWCVTPQRRSASSWSSTVRERCA